MEIMTALNVIEMFVQHSLWHKIYTQTLPQSRQFQAKLNRIHVGFLEMICGSKSDSFGASKNCDDGTNVLDFFFLFFINSL